MNNVKKVKEKVVCYTKQDHKTRTKEKNVNTRTNNLNYVNYLLCV
jgi:hypothetical protein